MLGTSLTRANTANMEEFLKMYSLMLEKSHGVRQGGSAALDLAYLACGYLDGYFIKGLQPWDIAAGSLLVTEAGGIMGDFSGESDYLNHGNIIAGNPKVFVQMLASLKPFAGK